MRNGSAETHLPSLSGVRGTNSFVDDGHVADRDCIQRHLASRQVFTRSDCNCYCVRLTFFSTGDGGLQSAQNFRKHVISGTRGKQGTSQKSKPFFHCTEISVDGRTGDTSCRRWLLLRGFGSFLQRSFTCHEVRVSWKQETGGNGGTVSQPFFFPDDDVEGKSVTVQQTN